MNGGGWFVWLAIACALPLGDQASVVSPEAEIVVEREPLAEGGERLTARAVYHGAGAGLQYRFATALHAASGQSRSLQSGTVDTGDVVLATSSVRVGTADAFTAHLVLSRGNRVLSEVHWSGAGR